MMTTTLNSPRAKRGWFCHIAASFGALFGLAVGGATAQEPAYAQKILRGEDPAPVEIMQAGCASCGNGLSAAPMLTGPIGGGCSSGSCGNGCATGNCKPGRHCPAECDDCGCFGRFFNGLYSCVCCPDYCYEPTWSPTANAAFFVDAARPRSQTRLRYDFGHNVRQPDRAEYFWGRIGTTGPGAVETSVNYSQLSLYTEAASEKFSLFVNMPYWVVDPTVNTYHSGFSDMDIGTKSLLVDCELMQIAFQFRTYIPIGRAGLGLGTGHVSLEPSILATVKLGTNTYFQGSVGEWIPIAGDPAFSGTMLKINGSLNHLLCEKGCSKWIGTMEFNSYIFQDGLYTDPFGVGQRASGEGYFSVGPGLRYTFCENLDIGFGTQISVTHDHFAEQVYRSEFRWRF